jgi:hypothetical protein
MCREVGMQTRTSALNVFKIHVSQEFEGCRSRCTHDGMSAEGGDVAQRRPVG